MHQFAWPTNDVFWIDTSKIQEKFQSICDLTSVSFVGTTSYRFQAYPVHFSLDSLLNQWSCPNQVLISGTDLK